MCKENATIAAAALRKERGRAKFCGPGLELVRGRTVSVISATPCAPRTGRCVVPPAVVNCGDRHYGQDLALRDGRWERPSRNLPASLEPACDTVNRKATIVIDTDSGRISLTLQQHWHYRKWNERLLKKCTRPT
jgi:hypothetical protein